MQWWEERYSSEWHIPGSFLQLDISRGQCCSQFLSQQRRSSNHQTSPVELNYHRGVLRGCRFAAQAPRPTPFAGPSVGAGRSTAAC
ncbi:hypothetical protein GW17_00057667 [Ensete ventricosum]|nr:hypothetical protein GW17_00057667 [Ensete ventricosum]